MFRNSLALPIAALVAAVLGFATLSLDLGWLRLPAAAAHPPAVDGAVGAGEYDHHYDAKEIGVTLDWVVEGDEIQMAVRAPAKGWAAVGWGGEGPIMAGFDIVIGYVDESGGHVQDNFADSPASHAADSALGGQSNLLASAATESADGTVLEFRRKLDTGDQYDHAIVAGPTPVILAYSDADDFMTYHEGSKTTAQLDFLGLAVGARQWVPEHLNEYEIGLLAWITILVVYGVVGVLSVWVEGKELVPEPPPAPGAAALALVALFALGALAGSVLFVREVVTNSTSITAIGLSGALWMWSLALAITVYRKYFMSGEVVQQDRYDEVPW